MNKLFRSGLADGAVAILFVILAVLQASEWMNGVEGSGTLAFLNFVIALTALRCALYERTIAKLFEASERNIDIFGV